MLRNVYRQRDLDRLLARVLQLRADAAGRWGRMTPHQAVCHLSDSMRATIGEWTKPPERTPPARALIRTIAFTLPVRWPHGVKTARELDQQRDGTKPVEFERDRAELVTLLRRIASSDRLPPHPLWGRMSRGMTGRYVWRHTDHHLRQFGA